ncbi:hypothetical protein [Nostoc sp.]|uniref:hypothetical protein n=1 Tax=Nostoc sp. TaxID=1180 RepID=UPI002FF461A2
MRYELRSNTTPVATTEGTSLWVHQSPTAGNPPTALDSPQRTGSSTIPNFVQKSNSNPIACKVATYCSLNTKPLFVDTLTMQKVAFK